MSGAHVVYISSPARSGSTLLDQLLACHPRITSIGEAVQLNAYALQDRTLYDPAYPLLCTCGVTLPECAFWSAVESELGMPLGDLSPRPRIIRPSDPGADGRKSINKWMIKVLWQWPQLYCWPPVHKALGGGRVGRDGFRLFDAIRSVSGTPYILDASKLPFRFWSLEAARPGHVRVILLTRDVRAVAYSQAKRGRTLNEAAYGWVHRMKQMEVLAARMPREQVARVRYEDLCTDPEKVLRELCDFLELDFFAGMMSRNTEELHHLGGSPSQFDPSRRHIRLDTHYMEELTTAELENLRGIAGDYGRRWGYT